MRKEAMRAAAVAKGYAVQELGHLTAIAETVVADAETGTYLVKIRVPAQGAFGLFVVNGAVTAETSLNDVVDAIASTPSAFVFHVQPLQREKERCGSGWTGDRCSKPLGHRGLHSNE